MRWRNAGGAAQADPLGRVVPLWNVLMSGSGHIRDDDRAWMEETAQPPVTHLPITTFLSIRFSIFLLHRFASNAIIY